MVKVQYSLVQLHQRTEVLVALALHRKGKTLALFSSQKQEQFFKDVFMNCGLTCIDVLSFQNFLHGHQLQQQYTCTVIMDIPTATQQLQLLLNKIKHSPLILLGKGQKKYINWIIKKVNNIELNQMTYSNKKFIDINHKIRLLIEQSYDLNRGAFYAYGSYINNFRANLLKRIFNTEDIDVHALARGFGFTVAPRVKEGKFLTSKALNIKKSGKKSQKLTEKKKKRHQVVQDALIDQTLQTQPVKQLKKATKTKKIRKV